MNLPFYIAKRYLFAKKSHNAVNVISLISVCGIAIATMAMVCALSVFNGFTEVVVKSFSAFDPDLQITVAQGKVFDPEVSVIRQIYDLPEIDLISESLEENALIKYGERQVAGLVKGVSPQFQEIAGIDNLIIDGTFTVKDGDVQFGVVGVGLAVTLGARANFIAPLEIYAPKRNIPVNLANPSTAFTKGYAYPAAIFSLNQQKYDDEMLIVSIELARELFRYENEVTSLNIKLQKGENVNAVKSKLQNLLGNEYLIKDRFEQQEESFRMVNIEKWVTFLILSFILVIACFNIIGSLSMLILDKNEDIDILRKLGANNQLVTRIFAVEGWMISISGALIGLVAGLILSLLQQYFGLLKLGDTPGAFIIDAYPVKVEPTDILFIFITVMIMGFLSVLYPVNNLRKQLNK